jgi:dUTP pyrophosphatase
MTTRLFEAVDSELKAYALGLVVFNIQNVKNDEVIVELSGNINVPIVVETALKQIDPAFENSLPFIVKQEDVSDICKHLGVDELSYNIDISHFVKNDGNKKEYVLEFLKAFYEKYGGVGLQDGADVCNVTANNKISLTSFAEYFGIPYKLGNIFNLSQISYSGANIVDLLGIIYKNTNLYIKDALYLQFLKLLNMERPTLKYVKISEDAVTPTKANFSDVGYDLSVTGVHKKLSTNTSLYKTGIKLEIPIGYYVEIVPRSSISKSGYLLANSIGIIDCSYKGELLVALTRIANVDEGETATAEFDYPFRCCQLIMRKQIFPDLVELNASELVDTCRQEGGFGSTST